MSKAHSLLVVEDELTLRRLLEYRLGKHYAVRTASNGEEALDAVREVPPDLIVSDVMMPRMNGFELQDALQTQKTTRAIPFIFLTAKADEKSRAKGLRTGVDDYITKPFDVEQLLSRIDRLLERAEVYRSELDAKIGRDLSQRLMPRALPEVPGYRADLRAQPHQHGGGDLFDWIESEPGVYYFTTGDVMGKGVQAKFYAYGFLGYIRNTLRSLLSEGSSASPATLMNRINEVLLRDEVMSETFVSLLLMRWEPAHHRVTYVNAGHCRPVLAGTSTTSLIEQSDLILGLKPDVTFEDTTFTIDEGTALLAYTDGLTEQHLRDGKPLGEEGVVELASTVRTTEEPLDQVLEMLGAYSATEGFQDDILLFWLQRWP